MLQRPSEGGVVTMGAQGSELAASKPLRCLTSCSQEQRCLPPAIPKAERRELKVVTGRFLHLSLPRHGDRGHSKFPGPRMAMADTECEASSSLSVLLMAWKGVRVGVLLPSDTRAGKRPGALGSERDRLQEIRQ